MSNTTSFCLIDTCNTVSTDDWKEYLHEEVADEDYKAFLDEHRFTEEQYSFEKFAVEDCGLLGEYDWIDEMSQLEVSDFWDNCSGAFDTKQEGFVITGHLGLWNGRPKVFKLVADGNIYEAIKACLGRSIEDFKVTADNGVVYVDGYHHDGTNSLEIHALSKKGADYVSRHEYDDELEVCRHLCEVKGLTKKIKVF